MTILPLCLSGLSYVAAGRPLIDSVDLEIRAGPPTVILGPNGAGKSLLLRLCHGLLQPGAGTVRWLGPGAAHAARRQAMVFQRPVLLRRSVFANLDYVLALRGLERSRRAERIAALLAETGLSGLAERPAPLLSGGEQQKLALARAWAVEPEILFLDEPTASLDPGATLAVEALIARIAAGGTKIVMTTHDMAQARRIAAEIVFLHRGRVLEQGPAAAFFAQPGTETAARFLAGHLV